MKFPAFTFDLQESEVFQTRFGDDARNNWIEGIDIVLPSWNDMDWSVLMEFVSKEDHDLVERILSGETFIAKGVDAVCKKYGIDGEAMDCYRFAEQWAYERAWMPTDEDITDALTEALEICQGEEMYGVLTDMYWCGVLASYPWYEITQDEEAVSAAVLKLGKVKGTTVTLSYAGTPYTRQLRKVTKDEGDEDLSFGGNSEMEIGTMWRYVSMAAIKRLETITNDRIERGPDVLDEDIRTHIRDYLGLKEP